MTQKLIDRAFSLRAVVITAMALCIVASMAGAKGEQEKTGGLRIATVDAARLMSESKFAINSTHDLQQRNDDEVAVLNSWKQNYLLPEADQKALGDLIVAQNHNPNGFSAAQKAQLQKLQDQSKQLSDDYSGLQTKNPTQLTQQERDRLTDYVKRTSDTQQRIDARQKQAEADIQNQLQTARSKAVKDVHESIAKIAKEKGYNLIYSSDVVFYADNDITDAVLNDLNKKPAQ